LTALVRPRAFGGSSLVRDYLEGSPAALSFYAGSPFRLESFAAKLGEVNRRFGRAERERAAAILRPGSTAASERLARFVEHGGAFVTTGQQAGFLTGPLYTIYKALSAAALARHLEQRLGILVLPLFWVASDDHDWAEVNHANVLDTRGRRVRFQLPSGDERPLPMSERCLEGDLESLCDEIGYVVAGKRDSQPYVRKVLDQYREAGRSVGEAFGAAVRELLGGYDLLLVDAAERCLKEASRGIVRQALTDAAQHEGRLAERTRLIEQAGYRGQVSVQERGTDVFLHGEAGRQRLYRRGEDFMLRGRGAGMSRAEVLARLEADAGSFSPNVLLRPVVESAVFPTLAYVGGPGELAYFAQAAALFEGYGMRPPVAVPRFAGTVVEPALERLLGKLRLTDEDLNLPRDTLRERLARREVPTALADALEAVREGVATSYERLIEEAGRLDPTLSGAVGSLRNRSLAAVARAERKFVRSLKRRELESLTQLERVLDSLRPEGLPQDRVLNVLPYLARYGGHFLAEVVRAIESTWRFPEAG
jgi:bacillithiol synthase